MLEEFVTIPKDEYIELLRGKAALLEKELAATGVAAFQPSKPHSWMSRTEKAEIFRLASLGLRSGEISKQLGRSRSTVQRCLTRIASINAQSSSGR